MFSIGALEQLTEPGTLRLCIARKVEYDGDTLRQESTNVWPQRAPQSGRAFDEWTFLPPSCRTRKSTSLRCSCFPVEPVASVPIAWGTAHTLPLLALPGADSHGADTASLSANVVTQLATIRLYRPPAIAPAFLETHVQSGRHNADIANPDTSHYRARTCSGSGLDASLCFSSPRIPL